MNGNINHTEVEDVSKIVVYEYWSDVPSENVPEDVASVLTEELGDWREMHFEDSLYVYIVGEDSWVTEESVHEMRIEA